MIYDPTMEGGWRSLASLRMVKGFHPAHEKSMRAFNLLYEIIYNIDKFGQRYFQVIKRKV